MAEEQKKFTEEQVANVVGNELFPALDKDGSGFLEKAEMRQLAGQIHEKWGDGNAFNEEAFDKGFAALDKSGDGKISKEEIIGFFVRVGRNRGLVE